MCERLTEGVGFNKSPLVAKYTISLRELAVQEIQSHIFNLPL